MKRFINSFRKTLNAKVKVSSLLMLICVAALSLTAVAAVATTVQATLSPDITVNYNGEVQKMADANGAEVYPLVYNGTTYVPIRAVSNMLAVPVDWDGPTRTVLLGDKNVDGTSLLKAGKLHSSTSSYWKAISGAQNLPQPADDFGDKTDTYTDGYRQDPVIASDVVLVVQPNQRQVQLSLTWSIAGGDKDIVYTAEVYDYDSKVVLSSVKFKGDQFIAVDNLNIAGVERLGFRITGTTTTINSTKGIGFLLNPIVK